MQLFPVQEPSGSIVKVVEAVRSPTELPYWSNPWAVYACEPPAGMEADAGASARWSRAPAVTVREAVPVLPPSVPVTVCAPALVAVQTLPLQEPSGAIEKVVESVTSPSGLPYWSRPWAE